MSTTPEEINCGNLDYNNPTVACKKAELTGRNSVDCRNGLTFIACIDEVNKCVNSYNSTKTNERNASREQWDRDAAQRVRDQQSWDSKVSQRKRDLENEDHHQGCGALGPANPGRCEGDFYEHRRDCCHRDGWGTCWTEKKICRRHGHSADAIAKNEAGARPGDMGPKPGEWQKTPDANPGSVSCCNNVVNIVNGQVQNSNIYQSCLTQSENPSAGAGAAGAGAGAAGSTTGAKNETNFDSDGNRTDTVDDSYTGEEEEDDGNKKMISFLIIFIVIFLCSSIAALLLLGDE